MGNGGKNSCEFPSHHRLHTSGKSLFKKQMLVSLVVSVGLKKREMQFDLKPAK